MYHKMNELEQEVDLVAQEACKNLLPDFFKTKISSIKSETWDVTDDYKYTDGGPVFECQMSINFDDYGWLDNFPHQDKIDITDNYFDHILDGAQLVKFINPHMKGLPILNYKISRVDHDYDREDLFKDSHYNCDLFLCLTIHTK